MNTKVKDILIRAIKTFFQGFIAVLLTFTFTSSTIIDKNFWLVLIISGIAGGISALQNSLKAYLETKKGE